MGTPTFQGAVSVINSYFGRNGILQIAEISKENWRTKESDIRIYEKSADGTKEAHVGRLDIEFPAPKGLDGRLQFYPNQPEISFGTSEPNARVFAEDAAREAGIYWIKEKRRSERTRIPPGEVAFLPYPTIFARPAAQMA